MNTKLITHVCFSILALFALAVTVTSPLLPKISSAFSLSMAESGLIFTANFVGFIIFVLASGMLADRFGKKRVISVSLIGFTAALFSFPFSSNFYSACILMFFVGGFGGTMESLASALVSELNTHKPSFYLNLAHIFFGIGAIIGPIFAGVLLARGIDWRICYYVLALLSLLLTVIFLTIKIPFTSTQSNFRFSELKFLLSDKKLLLVCLCMFLYTGSELGSWGWMSTFLKENFHLSEIKSSLSVSVFWLFMTIGRIICGNLTLRFHIRHILMVLGYSSAVVTFLSIFATREYTLWIAIAVMGLAYSSQWPLIVSYGSNLNKNPSGTVFSLLVGSGGIGTAVIPYLMGIMGEHIGITAAMASPALLLLFTALIFTYLKEPS